MSADNGIYILKTLKTLKTLKGYGFEYRVAHLQGVENYQWDDTKQNPDKDYVGDYTDDPDVQIINARLLWKDCAVHTDQDAAWKVAEAIYDDIMKDDMCPIVEYGISVIYIPREFKVARRRTKTDSRRK